MANPRLAANLDELLALDLPSDVVVGRYPGRYDILFRKGNAQLLVSVCFGSETYHVGGNAPVAAKSRDDVWHAATLFARVRDFLSVLNTLGVRDSHH